MATYKVLQDIEAEDHIVGPLTFRQFVYALVAMLFFYISFIVATKGAPFLLIVFGPPGLLLAFFAFPFGKDQPTEVWALAKIRFLFKPRRRIWDQSGVKELVTVTAPKHIEHAYTNGLTPTEVNSRLRALASTIDSRGWAIKNVNVNLYAQPSLLASEGDSDRLIDPSAIPQAVSDIDVRPADDMLDEQNNPIAQQFNQLISASTTAHRKQLIDELNGIRRAQGAAAPNDYWFMNQPAAAPPAGQAVFTKAQVVQPGTEEEQPATSEATPSEQAVIDRLKAQASATPDFQSHLKTIQPLGAAGSSTPPDDDVPSILAPAPSPAAADPVILGLSRDNDKNVATLAREAHRAKNPDEPQDEVVISLR